MLTLVYALSAGATAEFDLECSVKLEPGSSETTKLTIYSTYENCAEGGETTYTTLGEGEESRLARGESTAKGSGTTYLIPEPFGGGRWTSIKFGVNYRYGNGHGGPGPFRAKGTYTELVDERLRTYKINLVCTSRGEIADCE